MKYLIFHLFRNYKFQRHQKTVIPLRKLDPTSNRLLPPGGFWAKLEEIFFELVSGTKFCNFYY
uniref:Uncharacterized protein n=1 Tax=Megaselia scalaris TaxID=36166 RepID=T1GKQ2_MEGSC